MSFQKQNFDIRGSLKSVIGKLLLVMFGILFAFNISICLIKSRNFFEVGIGQLLLLLAICFAFFVFWIKSYKVAFRENKLIYKSIFVKQTSIELSEIKTVKYQSGGLNHYEKKSKLYPKILLYPLSSEKIGLIEITLNVFNHNDLQKFYDLLESINKFPLKSNVRKKQIDTPPSDV